jgi:integrase/recombinase XerD
VFFSHFDLLICERPRAHDGRGILKRNKMPRVNRSKKIREAKAKQTQTVVIYSDEQINAMLKVSTEDEKDLIKFLLQTGVRDKEAAHCEWSDIDGVNLNLKDKPRYEWRLKDKENRSVPLSPKLIARLKARRIRQEKAAEKEGREASNLIFPNSLGNPDLALDNRLHKIVAKVKESGFAWEGEVTMHKFRKNYATFMHRAGCDMTTVRDLLGHSDTKTTELYVAIDASKAADVSRIAFQAFGD